MDPEPPTRHDADRLQVSQCRHGIHSQIVQVISVVADRHGRRPGTKAGSNQGAYNPPPEAAALHTQSN